MGDCTGTHVRTEEMLQDALIAHQQEDFDTAELIYYGILAECPEHSEALMGLGLLYQATGQPLRAVAVIEQLVGLKPGEPEPYLQLGGLYHAMGQTDRAILQYEAATKAAPENGRAFYNLGVACFAAGENRRAIAAYQQAIRLDPHDVDSRFNLAACYTGVGDDAAAFRCYEEARAFAPYDNDILYNLALLHKKNRQHDRAVALLEKLRDLNADYAPAYSHLGALYHHLGRTDAALRCFERLLELDHDVEAASHMLAALRGEPVGAPQPGYVKKLFDCYAPTFEQELVERLDYKAPALLRRLIDPLMPASGKFERILDLGCGTGLAGEAFRAIASQLVGVDLSAVMVEQAERKSLYDELVVGDIIEFCRYRPAQYDLIVAADVLVYLGDLDQLFAAVAERLQPGGYFAFSSESCQAAPFALQPTGRFAHATAYLLDLGDKHGFAVSRHERCGLRREKGEWQEGELLILNRPG